MNTIRKQNFKNKTKMKHYIYLLCGVFGCLNYDVQVDCMRNIYDKLTDYLLAAYKSNCGEAIYKDMSSVDTTNNNLYDNLATYINLMSDFSNQGLKPQYIKNAFIATVNNHFSDKSNQYCWYPVPLTQDEVSRFFESYENTMQNIDGLCKEKFGEQGCTLIRETINNKDVELLAISFYGYRQNNVFRTHLANELKEQLLVQQTKEKDSFMCRITGMGCQTGPKPTQDNTTRSNTHNNTEIDCQTWANCNESTPCPVECQQCTAYDEQTNNTTDCDKLIQCSDYCKYCPANGEPTPNITKQQADSIAAHPAYMFYDKKCYECHNGKCEQSECDKIIKILNDNNHHNSHSLIGPIMLGVAIGAVIGISYYGYKKWKSRRHNLNNQANLNDQQGNNQNNQDNQNHQPDNNNPNNQQLQQQITALQNQIAQLPGQLQQLLMQGQQQNNDQLDGANELLPHAVHLQNGAILIPAQDVPALMQLIVDNQ